MSAARAEEYQTVLAEARDAGGASAGERTRGVRRLRADLHRIRRRDVFPLPERDLAVTAVEKLAGAVGATATTGAGSRRP
jgi:hypothetical protein